MMVTRRRWYTAQQYEQRFWADLARQVGSGTRNQLNWYQWKASKLEKRMEKCADGGQNTRGRILEIGSGPIGIINFVGWGERFAIDPLEDFYKQSSTLTKLRKPDVTYTKGTAEGLPYPENFFSLVIIDNVIDHTHGPARALHEIYRVLDYKGLLYLSVNIRTVWGALVHKLLATCRIDKGHPHTFTRGSVRNLLTANHFEIRLEEIEDYRNAKQKDSQSTKIKERIKGYTGISEFVYHAICQKVSTS